MEILHTLFVIGYVLIAAFLVYLVLNQEPKSGGAGDLLGGSSDLFSARGVTGGLYRLTVVLGVVFVVSALILGVWRI
ncbi:preprotein translocase, SecG subunit [Calidithermus terrae]|uniref:Protein-export membrane protein SecG n=1 Tax=Calidithermus terrae TaxID=1408545 RepID=A0A399EIB8_9DEIN|nr:preprotein translocase subunit SecG [Calidithermus terrae]RIH83865.1 preprotein translocase, SecG subunit [Calidithermus terrae]